MVLLVCRLRSRSTGQQLSRRPRACVRRTADRADWRAALRDHRALCVAACGLAGNSSSNSSSSSSGGQTAPVRITCYSSQLCDTPNLGAQPFNSPPQTQALPSFSGGVRGCNSAQQSGKKTRDAKGNTFSGQHAFSGAAQQGSQHLQHTTSTLAGSNLPCPVNNHAPRPGLNLPNYSQQPMCRLSEQIQGSHRAPVHAHTQRPATSSATPSMSLRAPLMLLFTSLPL
jgi:hypothetical protein